MPIVFAIFKLPFFVGLLRKSKPEFIKVVGASLALAALLATSATGATAPPLRLVRVAVDRTATSLAQHATIVEPDAVASGTRIVSTFQVGRYFGGSSGRIGFARSTDAGRTWRSGLLPGVGVPSSQASDPVVAFDALHGTWLITSLVNTESTSSLAILRSADGLAWTGPFTAIAYPREESGEGTALDKEWLTCDNGPSPFAGRCYLAYTDLAHPNAAGRLEPKLGVQSSSDGGLTWSTPVLLDVEAEQVSPAVQPVVRPNGELVVVFFEDGIVEAVRSNDGGATFTPRERVSNLQVASTRPLRGFSLPTATVDREGNVYAAWPDCRFRSTCTRNDIVWSRSGAAGVWTPVGRMPLGAVRTAPNFTIPDLTVDPASANRLGLTYYALSASGLLDTYLVTSRNAGRTWSKPRRLNPARMRLTWIAQTSSGRMVGDYMGTVFSGSRLVAVHVQARTPRAGRLNEALYAASIPRP
jgi:hypothetical protein